jgi:hypothetical protein
MGTLLDVRGMGSAMRPGNPSPIFNELSGVRVWRVGPFSKHTLELRFKRQIFMIFIVDYFCKKGFLKLKKI